MKSTILYVLFAALLWGQEPKARRLQSVVIDAVEWKVRVNVAEGHMEGDTFVAEKLMPEYTIDPDKQIMSDGQDSRGFNKDKQASAMEAQALEKLMDTLSEYAAESVKWWLQGEGVPAPEKKGKTVASRHGPTFPPDPWKSK